MFIVPVGELEGFVRNIGVHGPQWVNAVLERYPDFNDGVYREIKEFVDVKNWKILEDLGK